MPPCVVFQLILHTMSIQYTPLGEEKRTFFPSDGKPFSMEKRALSEPCIPLRCAHRVDVCQRQKYQAPLQALQVVASTANQVESEAFAAASKAGTDGDGEWMNEGLEIETKRSMGRCLLLTARQHSPGLPCNSLLARDRTIREACGGKQKRFVDRISRATFPTCSEAHFSIHLLPNKSRATNRSYVHASSAWIDDEHDTSSRHQHHCCEPV